jgi:small subunit ribosomal protein S16
MKDATAVKRRSVQPSAFGIQALNIYCERSTKHPALPQKSFKDRYLHTRCCMQCLANPCNLRDNKNLPSQGWVLFRKGFRETVLMIRLARIGARKQPYYRVVVIDKERARNGRSVEVVGLYNPRTNPTTIDLKRDRIDYWVSRGAQLSDTVSRLLTRAQSAATPAA